MDFQDVINDVYAHPFGQTFGSLTQIHWLTYVGTILFAAAYYAFRRRGKQIRLRAMIRYLFPRKIFGHGSSFLDIKLFVFAILYIFLQSGLLVLFSRSCNHFIAVLLQAGFNSDDPFFPGTSPAAKIILPIVVFLVFELGYWVAHYMLHKIPFLWEFHKVHHSAEIMTPITELRQHPVELFLAPIVSSVFLSVVYGTIVFLYGENAEIYKFWDMGIFIVIFFATFGHLRHSHIHIASSGILSYLVQSPVHHHIHHSTERRHFDKNLGFCLSIWDWLFGTLYLPEKNMKIEYGLPDPLTTNYSAKDHLLLPFREAYRVLRGRKKPFGPTGSLY